MTTFEGTTADASGYEQIYVTPPATTYLAAVWGIKFFQLKSTPPEGGFYSIPSGACVIVATLRQPLAPSAFFATFGGTVTNGPAD
ncbi:MAG: hypothetical protein ACK4QP_07550 [Pseudorhizobium sp.]